MYYVLRFATMILPWLPERLRAYLATGIGLFAWCIAGEARKRANQNLSHVLGLEASNNRRGRRERRKVVRGMFQHNVRNYIEVCVLGQHTIEKHQRMAEEIGYEHIDAALAKGKGVIAITAHYGPFDHIVQSAAYRGYELIIPVEELKDRRLLDLMLQLRGSQGLQFVPLGTTSTLRAIMQGLKSNKIVVLTADRGSQGQKERVRFFDTEAELPNGAVMLAQKTGAELIGAFAIRTSATKIRLECVPITAGMTAEQRRDSSYVLRKVSERMEEFIRKHPEQWLAFTPIWPESDLLVDGARRSGIAEA